MTKRKASAAKEATAPTKVGGRELVACPICGGFGGVQDKDGDDWEVCKKCGGGGKVYANEVAK